MDRKGFTLIEILMVIGLIAILAVGSIEMMSGKVDETRYEQTIALMNQIRNGMVGNPEIKEGGVRTSFGYLGDIGTIPDPASEGIAGLITNMGAYPAWAMNATARIPMGWNGPYLTGGTTSTDYTKDAWGTAFVYDRAAATLTSYGADRVAGGTSYNADIILKLTDNLNVTVTGFVCNNGGPITTTADVELNYPNGSGALQTDLVNILVAAQGAYSFSSIPLGIHSVKVYYPSKVAPTKTIGPILFTVDRPNAQIPCDRTDIGT